MPTPFPLDASTLGSGDAGDEAARLATLRYVYRGEVGIVDEPARLIRSATVGRGNGPNGLALGADPQASRRHAEFEYRADTLRIRDVGSRNGVSVNGVKVAASPLVDGDVVRLGASFAVVRFEDPRQLDVPSARLMGASPALQALRVAVARVGPEPASVLIEGESGVGKEVVARSIHEASGRDGRFVAVNCAAITESLAESQLFGHVAGAFTGAKGDHEGFFLAASGGTLFLDEIGDMPLSLQPKLLRALETRRVNPVGASTTLGFDARVIAATNADLRAKVAAASFRGDLYARLAQLTMPILPLRERPEDILLLAREHLREAPPLAPDLVEALLTAAWPHNVRELIAVATELRVWGKDKPRLEVDLVAHRLTPRGTRVPGITQPLAPPVPDSDPRIPERHELIALLRKHSGNVKAVSQEAGRSRTQVYRWLQRYELDLQDYR